jgi:hypothetical protein
LRRVVGQDATSAVVISGVSDWNGRTTSDSAGMVPSEQVTTLPWTKQEGDGGTLVNSPRCTVRSTS